MMKYCRPTDQFKYGRCQVCVFLAGKISCTECCFLSILAEMMNADDAAKNKLQEVSTVIPVIHFTISFSYTHHRINAL